MSQRALLSALRRIEKLTRERDAAKAKLAELEADVPKAIVGAANAMLQVDEESNERIVELEKLLVGGAGRIARERLAQVEREGFTAEHDDQHAWGQLAVAGAWYALLTLDHESANRYEVEFPFSDAWKKDDGDLRNLEKAGALIASELDRHIRARAREA